MPAGQTPHTVVVYAHNDLVDKVQPGDRITVTGIYRAVPLRVNPIVRNVKSVYRTHIDAVHFRKVDVHRLRNETEKGLVRFIMLLFFLLHDANEKRINFRKETRFLPEREAILHELSQ